jgi:hypothetical protein
MPADVGKGGGAAQRGFFEIPVSRRYRYLHQAIRRRGTCLLRADASLDPSLRVGVHAAGGPRQRRGTWPNGEWGSSCHMLGPVPRIGVQSLVDCQ